MSNTSTYTNTVTYTDVDVENVVRRFTADMVMIASSTKAITEQTAREYGHDVEYLAKKGFLKHVDVTLLSNGIEKNATRYDILLGSGELTMSRPGGLMWPIVDTPWLRIILFYTEAYNDAAKESHKSKLKKSWSATDADTSHSKLSASAGRDYSSGGFGMARKDYQ